MRPKGSVRTLPPFLLCAPVCVLMAVPFVALITNTSWAAFHLAYGDWDAVGVSAGLGLIAMAVIFVLGVPLALWLARTSSRMRPLVDTLVLAAIMTPPLAMGILLISAYGPYGTVGEMLDQIGVSLNNNAAAFIVAQIYGGIGYFVLAARSAFEAVPVSDEEAARTLGAGRVQTFLLVTFPLAFRGIAAGLILAWVRIMGEFGIVVVFSYFPHGVPVALYTNLQNEGVDAVYALLWLMLAVTLPIPLIMLAALGQTGSWPLTIRLRPETDIR
jgi:molybdate/tungstate transport system permease protein